AVIYDGIGDLFLKADLSEGRQMSVRVKYNLPERYWLSLSTLEPRKNISLLIRAYTDACRVDPEAVPPLVLAGRMGWKDSELDKILQAEGKAGQVGEGSSGNIGNARGLIKDRLIFTGFIDDQDLPVVYHMAEKFIFPSKYEGFGLPPLEALSVGTAVISSDAASLPEVLGDSAVYFENGDQKDLETLLISAAKESKMRDVAAAEDDLTCPETRLYSGEYQKYRINPEYDWRRSGMRLIREIDRI
ncbi:MAG: glycosyltransferase family 4 protein, partial [Lachnospiraceae bacterium]|nr:glycosyltransferase family 4 protein [Lachnospiraceae bacterium]